MDEAYFYVGVSIVVQQRIEGIVTNACAGGIGDCTGQLCCTDSVGHLHNGNCGEIGGGAVRNHEFAHRLITCIIPDFGVPNVYCDSFRGDGSAAAGLADTENDVRLEFFRFGQDGFSGKSEDCRNLQFIYFKISDLIR